MRAAVLHGLHQPFEVHDDVTVDGPNDGEVRVRVRASGVCRTDHSLQDGGLPHPLPCIAGHEGAGEVIAVGDGVTQVTIGDHVIVSWIPICGRCTFCLEGKPQLCAATGSTVRQRFRVDGEPVWAGIGTATFAQETILPEVGVVKVPDDVPFELAALIGCGVTTGVGAALNTARVRPGSSVVVIGGGGVGLNIVQGARVAGAAEIAVVDPIASKHEWARRFGATHTATPDAVAQLVGEVTDGLGFDYAFEAIGRPETIRAAWDATKRGGTTTIVGAGRPEHVVTFNPFELFFQERKLLGCVYGSADPRVEFPRILRLWRTGRLDLESLITHRIALDDINDAFAAMDAGESIRTVVTL